MGKYAYVFLLYGDSEYFLGTILAGYTLRKTKPKHDVVLMVTDDVPENQIIILKKYFNKIITVDYIDTHPDNFVKDDTRFTKVFTKLNLFNLTEYDKVLMLDVDIFMVNNVDHLFELPTPAAHFRNKKLDHGSKIDSNLITLKNGRINGGVNAGTMLLKPDANEFKDMIKEIKKPLRFKLLGPEQDYLSYRYKDNIYHLDFAYCCKFDMDKEMNWYNYSIHDIYILQYSWIFKPWDLVLDNKEHVFNKLKEFGKDITYYALWANHYRIVNREFKENGIILKNMYTRKNIFSSLIDEKSKK